jgi:hypothetical protein
LSRCRNCACIGPNYLDCWNKYWSWTKTDGTRHRKLLWLPGEWIIHGYRAHLLVPVFDRVGIEIGPIPADLKALPRGANDEQARQVFPDYVVNRGHYFGADLSDADKQALITFLKTF